MSQIQASLTQKDMQERESEIEQLRIKLQQLQIEMNNKIGEYKIYRNFLECYLKYLVLVNKGEKATTEKYFPPLRNFFKNFDIDQLFPDRLWDFSVTYQFHIDVSAQSYWFPKIFWMMRIVLQGKFQSKNSLFDIVEIHGGSLKLPYSHYYCMEFSKERRVSYNFSLIFSVYPQKKLKLNEVGQLVGFSFIHNITFIAVKSFYSNFEQESLKLVNDHINEQYNEFTSYGDMKLQKYYQIQLQLKKYLKK